MLYSNAKIDPFRMSKSFCDKQSCPALFFLPLQTNSRQIRKGFSVRRTDLFKKTGKYLADPNEARGCSIKSLVIN